MYYKTVLKESRVCLWAAHALPISKCWGKSLGVCTFCWNRQSQADYFKSKISFIKLRWSDIKMLDLEWYLIHDILLWKIKKFGSKYNTFQVCHWSVLHVMGLHANKPGRTSWLDFNCLPRGFWRLSIWYQSIRIACVLLACEKRHKLPASYCILLVQKMYETTITIISNKDVCVYIQIICMLLLYVSE